MYNIFCLIYTINYCVSILFCLMCNNFANKGTSEEKSMMHGPMTMKKRKENSTDKLYSRAEAIQWFYKHHSNLCHDTNRHISSHMNRKNLHVKSFPTTLHHIQIFIHKIKFPLKIILIHTTQQMNQKYRVKSIGVWMR